MAKSGLACALSEPAIADVDFELLLPWHASGALDEAGSRRVATAMAQNPSLARDYRAIQRERAAVAEMGEQRGTPSLRPMLALFAAIEADTPRPPKVVATKVAGATRYAAGVKFS